MTDRTSTPLGWPGPQGLFDPSREKDSCGVGFVAHLKGVRSHQIIQDAIVMNDHMVHRGGCGREAQTGDGAGIFVQMPDRFLRKELAQSEIDLPQEGDYAAGIVFLSPQLAERSAVKEVFEHIIREEGQRLLGWRHVPVASAILGKTSAHYEPVLEQVFIGKVGDFSDPLDWERKLYVIRRRVMNTIRHNDVPQQLFGVHQVPVQYFPGSEYFYICSLSARILVYKGMLTPEQLGPYFQDLHDEDFISALALVHSRFSTNTFPSWPRAQPNRFTAHNGEINTIMGNVNDMRARQALCASPALGEDLEKVCPVIQEEGSDSTRFDNVLEFLHLGGYSLPHSVMMLLPEPWERDTSMPQVKRDFYEYHATLMEPWDGPASMTFSDGTLIGTVLDRNGLRPSRYYITRDDRVIMASEVGVVPIDPATIIQKGRLQPGRMFLVDTRAGRIIEDEEIKLKLATAKPYGEWLRQYRIPIEDLPVPTQLPAMDEAGIQQRQRAFGYTDETLRVILAPTAEQAAQPTGSMGNDTPLAVFSDKPQLLYAYFKQIFAQVTNPPLDAIREAIITATETFLGSEGNLLQPGPESCRMIRLHSPLLTNSQLETLRQINRPGFKAATLPICFDPDGGASGLEGALDALFEACDRAMEQGVNLIILSDREVDPEKAPIPLTLAMGGLHHHLIQRETRTQVSILLESGECYEVHYFALLLGFGADAINPYMAFESLLGLIREKTLTLTLEEAIARYLEGSIKGVVQTMAKMGISTVSSYRGAQIFEAIGLSTHLVRKYFTGTASRIEGIGLPEIAEEVALRHRKAFPRHNIYIPNENAGCEATQTPCFQSPKVERSGILNRDEYKPEGRTTLDPGGLYQWHPTGEHHRFNPQTIRTLQEAVRSEDYDTFKVYSSLANDHAKHNGTLRGLMGLKWARDPIALDEVEPVEGILKRFRTAAMSWGSISKEAHETLAIAMNRIGGRSNSGEGGEDPERFTPMANGDSKRSAIKQVASGRFGVTGHYLVNADELQIKIAQGASPGEGGELPASKVSPWIAKIRHSTAGVGLIAPPSHHDIYSIEDLSELIYDLRNANPNARISVKLGAEVGIGMIASGVAKANADVILISGHDGGTGASPISSIYHAGIPWELGIAETNQILLINDLRNRVVLEVEGQMKTGRDVVVGALLGAEAFSFATAPLVSLGCVMTRACQKNTCPTGIATQDPSLRTQFTGKPEHVVHFMRFIAQEVRELMAALGFRTFNEMVGRVDKLEAETTVEHWKTRGVDLTTILHQPDVRHKVRTYSQKPRNHGLEHTLDNTHLLELCKPAIDHREQVKFTLPIQNINRAAGTLTGSAISHKYGAEGLPKDTIWIHFQGSAGQSMGAFCPKGMTFELEGDANDYLGKGLSGAKLILYPPNNSTFKAEENIIAGNVCFYGATAGEAYIRGLAGERFCVRNSGVRVVVEGIGDHGCEYMTEGRVIILGQTGRNFAAGMSGGIAYVFDEDGRFSSRLNHEQVNCYPLAKADEKEIGEVRQMIENHLCYTGSHRAKHILAHWEASLAHLAKVLPLCFL